MYCVNQLLKAWGFAKVVLLREQYKRVGVCPFNQRDSTVEKFKLFVNNFPEFKQIIEARCTETEGSQGRA